MEITIKSDKQNKILNRRELDFVVKYEGPTPSRTDVRKKLCALLNTEINLTLIQSMHSEYGVSEASGYAKIYDSEERMKTVEAKHVLERNTVPEEQKTDEGGSENADE